MASMKKFLTGLVAGSCLVLGAGVWASSAVAQTELDPFSNVGTDDDGAGVFGDSSDPFDIIHRAIQTPTLSAEDFFNQQTRNISTEAQQLRMRQRELFRQQQSDDLSIEGTEEITVDDDAI